MKLRNILKWFVVITVVLSVGFVLGYSSGQVQKIPLTPSSNLFSTGTLIRNIGVALFAISVWYSQNRLNRANQLLRTLKVDNDKHTALELVVSLRDIEGLEELDCSIDPRDVELIKRKISGLKQADRFRNLSIILFLAGVSIELYEVVLNWLG